MEHLNIKIYGRTQGVFFRDSSRRKAKKLGLKGFVRNEDDGTVYIEAEGEKDALKQFVDWCHKGSWLAKVEKVDYQSTSEIKNFPDFVIEF